MDELFHNDIDNMYFRKYMVNFMPTLKNIQ